MHLFFFLGSLLNLCSLKNQDHLLKLIVSTLDYSRDGLARVILSKILTAATDVRKRATVLRAGLPLTLLSVINKTCFLLKVFWISNEVLECTLVQNGRLYATKHLRVLLRANVEFFSNWGMELLVTQLHDRNKAVSIEALDILDEACEDKVTSVYP